MNNILDFLQSDNENKLWIYNEKINIYKKYNQFYEEKEDIQPIINKEKEDITLKIKEKEDIKVIFNEEKEDIQPIINKEKEDITLKIKEKEDIKVIFNKEKKDITPIINKEKEDIQVIFNKEKKDITSKIKEKEDIQPIINKEKENKKQYPLDIILEYSNTDPIVKQNVKDLLITFIGKTNKLFGLKKTAEIMTGITKNSWNQSVVLFLSFFLDKTIIYKEKKYLFNENKNNGTIIIN